MTWHRLGTTTGTSEALGGVDPHVVQVHQVYDSRCPACRQQVEKTIEAIRPAIQADGGDIILRGVDEDTGVVTVELVGACVTCPASTDT